MADALAIILGIAASLLGHDSFAVREEAQVHVAQLPAEILATLSSNDDPEIAMRARRALRESYCSRWKILSGEWGRRKWPWMDSMLDELHEGYAVTILDPDAVDVTPPDWVHYRFATRCWAESQIMDGRPISEVRAILIEMERRCVYWSLHSKYPDPA